MIYRAQHTREASPRARKWGTVTVAAGFTALAGAAAGAIYKAWDSLTSDGIRGAAMAVAETLSNDSVAAPAGVIMGAVAVGSLVGLYKSHTAPATQEFGNGGFLIAAHEHVAARSDIPLEEDHTMIMRLPTAAPIELPAPVRPQVYSFNSTTGVSVPVVPSTMALARA